MQKLSLFSRGFRREETRTFIGRKEAEREVERRFWPSYFVIFELEGGVGVDFRRDLREEGELER